MNDFIELNEKINKYNQEALNMLFNNFEKDEEEKMEWSQDMFIGFDKNREIE
jgi:hypothetical protein